MSDATFRLSWTDGRAILAWNGGFTLVFGYTVSESGVEVELGEDKILPPPAALVRMDVGAMNSSIWLIGRDCFSSDRLETRPEAEDARRFRFLANAYVSGQPMLEPFDAAFLAAKTIGDFRSACDQAMRATDEKRPKP